MSRSAIGRRREYDTSDPQPSSAEQFSDTMDNINLGYNGVASVYYGVNGAFDWGYDGTDKMDKADRYGTAVESTLSSTLGLIGNIGTYASNRAQRKKAKNSYVKNRELTGRSWANTFSLLGNVSSLGRGIANFAGDTNEEGSNAEKADQWLGALSTGLSTFSSGVNWFTSARSNSDRKEISKKLGEISDTAEDIDEDTAKSQMGADSAEYHSFMAKKFALRQAKKFQDNRSTRYHKGAISTIAGAIASSGMISAAFAPFGKTGWGKMLSGAMPLVGWIGDMIEKKASDTSDENAAKDDQKTKDDEVTEFLDDHRAASDPTKTREYRDRLTLQNELGLQSIDLCDDPLDDEEKKLAFEALTHKRARDIMLSKDTDKEQIYKALHLSDTPNIDEIVAALKGE